VITDTELGTPTKSERVLGRSGAECLEPEEKQTMGVAKKAAKSVAKDSAKDVADKAIDKGPVDKAEDIVDDADLGKKAVKKVL